MPLPETLIAANPDFYLDYTLRSWIGKPDAISSEALHEYRRCFRKLSVIQAACADYRAGLSVDVAHDRADRAARRVIECPMLAMWAAQRTDGRVYDPLQIWQRWAGTVQGLEIDCGHFLMEEAPEATSTALIEFFREL